MLGRGSGFENGKAQMGELDRRGEGERAREQSILQSRESNYPSYVGSVSGNVYLRKEKVVKKEGE